MALFGTALDGRRATEVGLAWECHTDDALLDAAIAFAARVAAAPRELTARVKESLRRAPWQPDFDAAIAFEVAHQTWSFGQGWFGSR